MTIGLAVKDVVLNWVDDKIRSPQSNVEDTLRVLGWDAIGAGGGVGSIGIRFAKTLSCDHVVDHIAIFNDMRHWETACKLIHPQAGSVLPINVASLSVPRGARYCPKADHMSMTGSSIV